MHNPYRGGTADVWYSHSKGDLWVEYKWIDRIPRKGSVIPDLSKLQLEWLTGRHDEGRRVAVVVGHPGGAALILSPQLWELGLPVAQFALLTRTKRALVEWIMT